LTMQASIRLLYVASDVDRHGNVRHYFRRNGRKVRLRGLPGSAEFMAAYQAALKASEGAEPVRRTIPPGSFEAACRAYYASRTFQDLDASTQAWRRRALDKIAETKGMALLAELTPQRVRKLRDEPESPGVGNQRLKAIKALLAWAFEDGMVPSNPAREVKLRSYATREHHSWTAEEMARFERAHPLGSTPFLAFAILTSTAGRREDAVRLGPQNVFGGRLVFTQAKNEHRRPVRIDIPIHPLLSAAIDELPADGRETFLMTAYGKPFTPAGFGLRFAEWCQRAELPDRCRAHGLRKATAAMLAEAGASAHEIMAVTGHRTLEEVERYTRAARQSLLADAAMARLVRPTGEGPNVPPGRKALESKG